jgi:hypothetical protein
MWNRALPEWSASIVFLSIGIVHKSPDGRIPGFQS